MSGSRNHNSETAQAHVDYLEGRIDLKQLEEILHPNGRPVFSQAVIKRLSGELKQQRLAREGKLKAAKLTLETATVQYLEGFMSLQTYLALVHGTS